MEEKLKAFIFERKKQHCLYLQTTFPGETPKESIHRKLQALINGFRTTELDQYIKITCVVLHTWEGTIQKLNQEKKSPIQKNKILRVKFNKRNASLVQ